MRSMIRRGLMRAGLAIRRGFLRLGLHVVPDRFCSPLPNVLELERTRSRWARPSTMAGIAVDLDAQEATLRAFCGPWQAEYAGSPLWHEARRRRFGFGFNSIDAEALHGVVRSLRPRRIVEVGSGVSTYIMAQLLARNRRDGAPAGRIVCIDPYPFPRLRELPDVELLTAPVDAVGVEPFLELGENDLLFMDGSHVSKPGSDVNFMMLEVLPRLRPGVVVHIHDIFFPYWYEPNILTSFFHWNETALVQAFLVGNEGVEILFSMSMLHHHRPRVLQQLFPDYVPQPLEQGLYPAGHRTLVPPPGHYPRSLYLRTRARG